MADSAKAVFLSYASQDAEAAKRICEALRAAGVEVWFDQSELVGGDAWDQKIRKQIGTCALFVPIISANTQARAEGYFRLEWKLADRRTDLIGKSKAFLLPVCIDDTKDSDADVPDSFLTVQWTKALGGEVPAGFAARVKKLLSGEVGWGLRPTPPSDKAGFGDPALQQTQNLKPSWKTYAGLAAGILVLVAGVSAFMLWPRRGPAEFAKPVSGTQATAANPIASAAPLTEVQQLVAKAWVQLNKTELGRSELEAAEELCKQALARDPNDADALAASAQVDACYVYFGFQDTPERREGARSKSSRALQIDPTGYEPRLARAAYLTRAWGGSGNPEVAPEAERGLRELLRERPGEPRALLTLGLLLRNIGRYAESYATFRQVTENPAFAALAWNELGWAQYLARDFVAAEASADRSIALHPYWANLNLKLYCSLFARGDLDQSKRILEQIPAASLQEDEGVLLAFYVYYLRREPAAGLRILANAPRDWYSAGGRSGPRSSFAGALHQMAGREAAARTEFAAALKVVEQRLAEKPSNPQLLRSKAFLLLQLGQRSEAETLFRSAWEIGGVNPELQTYDFVLLGRLDEAVAALERAAADRSFFALPAILRLDPDLDPLRNHPGFLELLAKLDAQGSDRAAPASDSRAPNPAPDTKSVAVLAFANLSDDKGNEYFSDGISEELLNVLAKVPGLKVTARTSAFFFKGKEVPIPEIAKQLGVAYVVEGSVRKQGDKVRITAQLIKAADGFHVWSDTFTRELKDVFAVQDEIADLIAQAMQLKLGMGSARKSAPVNPQAFELYVQARQAWSLRTIEGFARAEQMLQRALQLAPDFGRARAALIDVGQMRSFRAGKLGTFGLRGAPELEQSLVQVRGVLALEPDLAEAYSTLGQTLDAKWQREEAGRAYRRATELNPNYATGRQWYGMHLAELGYMDEALAELKAASELDPFSFIILDNYGWLLNLAGRNREAVQMLDRAAALNPGFDQTARAKATALAALGRTAEAQAIARPLKNTQRELDVWTLGLVGLHDEANTLLQRMDPGDVTTRYQALLAAGQREASLDALADLSGVSKGGVIDVLYQRIYDPLRDDPRFVRFVAAIGLTEAHARAQAWRAAHPPDIPEMKP